MVLTRLEVEGKMVLGGSHYDLFDSRPYRLVVR